MREATKVVATCDACGARLSADNVDRTGPKRTPVCAFCYEPVTLKKEPHRE